MDLILFLLHDQSMFTGAKQKILMKYPLLRDIVSKGK